MLTLRTITGKSICLPECLSGCQLQNTAVLKSVRGQPYPEEDKDADYSGDLATAALLDQQKQREGETDP